MDYTTLRAALFLEEKQGNVFRKTDGPHPSFELWCYTPALPVKREWNSINRLARGLVLDTHAERVYWTVPKFFNLFENGVGLANLPAEPFRIENKWDGSLGLAWYDPYGKRWRVSTKGSFNSEQAVWATDYLYSFSLTGRLDPSKTYLFEIIYPENRIVIDYGGEETMVPLMVFDANGVEEDVPSGLFPTDLFWPNLPQPPRPIEDLLEFAKTETYNTEGWVIRFQSGLRLKIKTDDYLRVHRLIAGVTEKRVYEILIAGIDPLVVASGLPDEFHREFLAITQRLLHEANKRYDSVAFCMQMALSEAWSRKDWAVWANSAKDKWVPAIVFGILDKIPKDDMIRNVLRTMQKSGFTAPKEVLPCSVSTPIS